MKNSTYLRFNKSNKGIALIAIFTLLFSFSINAQVFWTENFNNGCTSLCLESAYAGVNGPWTMTNSGPPTACGVATTPNEWYVSCSENGNPVGSGGSSCGGAVPAGCVAGSPSNATLHVGNISTSPSAAFFCPLGDCGASYDSGGNCYLLGSGASTATDKRAESPVINCTGHTGITLAFDYIENGEPGADFCTIEYSINSGATWLVLNVPGTTALCGAQGVWTAFSMVLPASCNNIATVKIAFHWVNDDSGTGTDPSFAVDDVTLSTSTNSITTGVLNPTTYCACSTINVPFTSTGTFNVGNVYKAELSDGLGSFAIPTIIGNLPSTANVGTIACTIPCNTPAGAGYLIQVISSNPGVTGSSNGPITINAADDATFNYSSPSYCQNGTTTPVISGFPTGTFSSVPATLVFVSTTTGDINLAGSPLGTYTITYLTSGPCPNSSTNTITITAAPVATFSYTGTPYCAGGANPSPTYAGGGVAGAFTSTGGLVFVAGGTAGQVDLTASTPGTYTVTNTIAASGSCPQVVATSTITINPVQSSAFSYPGSTFCQTGVNPSPAITGAFGGTFSSTAGLVFVSTLTGQINLIGSVLGTYVITYTSPNPCGTSSTFTVTITTAPVATFSYTGTPYCEFAANPSPTFTGGGSAGLFSAAPAGLIFVSTSTGVVDLSLSIPGTYTVTNTIAASGGCVAASANSTITIVASASASFSYIGSPYCQSGLNPSPTYTGGGIAGNFTSTAGLNIVASTGAVDLALSTPGTYTVTNTVPGIGACPPSVATATITIATALVATFSYTGTPYCSNAGTATPTFSGGGIAGTFTSTPGLIINGATGVVTLGSSTAGTYTVTNTIPASGSCAATVATSTITITLAGIATFNYTPSTYCQSGANPSPTFTGGGVAGTFSAPAGLTINAVTGLVTLTSSTAGTYTVTNTIAANGGCPAVIATSSITIITSPVATFGYLNPSYCQSAANPSPTFGGGGVAGVFTAAPAGLIINGATGLISLATSTPGTYTVTNSIAAAGGCPAATATATITVNATPIVTVTSITLCSGSTGTITAGGATTYTWSAGATGGAGSTATVSPVATTTYTVTGTTGTCTGTAISTVTVQVCNPPVANFVANPLVICNSGCVTYYDSSTNNPTSWQWSFPGGVPNSANTQGPINVCYSGIGAYSSELIVTNATGADTLFRQNYVNIVAPIQPSISASENPINACESTRLTAEPLGSAYLWGPGGDCNTCQTVTVSPTSTTQYWLAYTDINGCSSTDTTVVTVTSIFTYFMPTGISPDCSCINNTLLVHGRGIDFINLKIFDRVGEKVFETSDILQGWDGTLHGLPMNENTLAYELVVTYCNGETAKENGSITIVR